MKDYQIWRTAADWIKRGENPLLIVIAETSGSSPGKPGFKMIVDQKGNFEGTIGGAIFEKNLISNPPQFDRKIWLKKFVHNPKAPESKRSGLNCAGSQETLFIQLDNGDLVWINQIIKSYDQSAPSFLKISSHQIHVEGIPRGEFQAPHRVPNFEKRKTDWVYQEFVGYPYTAHIFGGGHTGIAVSKLLSFLGFRTVVIDDRELEMHLNNPYAHRIVVKSFKEYASALNASPRDFIIICTYSLATDTEVAATVFTKPFPYIGLMGSKAKLHKISEKVGSSMFEKIIAPIGLPINDETVEEIAVSIAAQVVKVKNSTS